MTSLRSFLARTSVLTMVVLRTCHGFYVPGVRPYEFAPGEEVPMKVNALTSIHTQIPKDFYRLPFCRPAGGPKMASENLGEFLTGNKIQNSAYSINSFARCSVLCQVTLSKVEAHTLATHIKYGYHNNWIIDNLPSAAVGTTASGQRQTHYAGGFPIGFYDKDSREAYVYNHVNIILEYHNPEGKDGHRVVGFKVLPMSVSHRYSGGFVWDAQRVSPSPYRPVIRVIIWLLRTVAARQLVEADASIIYTYDVTWEYSETAWASRWDVYLSEDHMVPCPGALVFNHQLHYGSGVPFGVGRFDFGSQPPDIAGYNALAALTDEEKEEEADESGWKLVHADVFRPPSTFPMLFCVMVGSGSQIGLCAFFTIGLAAVGFLSPARRGSLMTAILVFTCCAEAWPDTPRPPLQKVSVDWQLCTLLTGTAFPGLCFFTFVFFNTILAFFRSTASVPFLDLVIVAAMWCCVSVPLVFLGAYFGYKEETISFPTVTSTIASDDSFWGSVRRAFLHHDIAVMDQFYYVFGFTLAVYIILLITCAEITVLLTYYQLCAENHRWWWFSFFTAGGTAFCTYGYSLIWFRSLEASKMLITYLLYFGYMFLICTAIFLVTGSVGMLTCLWFIRKIFSSIKVD
ncbi:LOW QUALITY PROTEIN: hypothetical protein ACHAW5_011124 [Stephanodiscus triporus]|uniref:Transmembrane 9 superfamily member n=1 Tax=Stephanodiscus triporus TaxID=2934178 RepID=A0ABD3NRF8_9STRA